MAAGSLPSKIGPYRVEAELGRGMMGVVYRARDGRWRRRRHLVALKVVHTALGLSAEQRAAFEKRFLQESRIVSGLSHAGIVGIYDVGHDRKHDAPYIAFEFLEGRTLATLLSEGRLEWREALRITARVAEALDYLHGNGVIHRDIKPANVMILPSGEPKVMDFGVAKAETGVELTTTGQFMGTPLYMAPEQALGEPVDGRADLFSLGSVLYTLLTGRRAFEADSVPKVLNLVTYRYPAPPTSLVPSLPADVDYVIARAMAKRKEDRYAGGRALAEDVEDLLAGRTPRHRSGWVMPDLGDGTMVRQRGPGLAADLLPELGLVAETERGRARGARPAMVLALSAVAFGSVLYSSAFWREQIAAGLGMKVPSAAPSSVPSAATRPVVAPAPSTLAADARAAWTGLAVPEQPLGPLPSLMPAPAPSEPAVAPVAAPPAAAVSPPARETAPPPTSRLSISLEHGLPAGRVRVLVDGQPVLEQKLTSRVKRDLLLFKVRSGSVQDVLPVAPGRRRVRVEVTAGGVLRAREITGTFRTGAARRLAVEVGKKGEPSLAWK
jgi:eukaryotic-like serine/threonine-protein kinase